MIALVFIGLPFAVRTVQPVLEALGREQEEAAASLGASRFTTLRRVVLPELLPALLTGFSLAFARALGEYGSVIFIAGNLPYKTEIAPLLITIRLEEYDYDGAIAIAALLLAASFVCLLAINADPAAVRARSAECSSAGARAPIRPAPPRWLRWALIALAVLIMALPVGDAAAMVLGAAFAEGVQRVVRRAGRTRCALGARS